MDSLSQVFLGVFDTPLSTIISHSSDLRSHATSVEFLFSVLNDYTSDLGSSPGSHLPLEL